MFADGSVYVGNEYCELSAIRADGQGDVTATHVCGRARTACPTRAAPWPPSEFVFLLTSFGTLTCYDAPRAACSGRRSSTTDFTASPSLVGSRLYLIGKAGKAWIVEPTARSATRLGEADLGEECVTSPAFQDGRIYLRGKNHLFCLGKL